MLALVEELPDDQAFAAALSGGRAFRGWGRDRHMAADIWDLTVAAAMAGSRKKAPTYPRPSKPPKGTRIMDLFRSGKKLGG